MIVNTMGVMIAIIPESERNQFNDEFRVYLEGGEWVANVLDVEELIHELQVLLGSV